MKQIENLTNLLDQQQKLTAGILSEEKSKGFWLKIFKKR
ncbi:hypothetical protein LACDD01_02145 [Lactococcus sp. DD01]|nr:hypothetical protein LACDD01_02145 [Lactococcus sp. DD01]